MGILFYFFAFQYLDHIATHRYRRYVNYTRELINFFTFCSATLSLSVELIQAKHIYLVYFVHVFSVSVIFHIIGWVIMQNVGNIYVVVYIGGNHSVGNMLLQISE